MSNPIEVAVSGTLAGSTYQGALTAVPLAYSLSGQQAHIQRSVIVEPADTFVTKTVDLSGGGKAGAKQTFFLLKSDLPVRFRLNGDDALVFEVERPDGFFTLPGTPEVTDVQFESTVTPVADAKVHITKILGQ